MKKFRQVKLSKSRIVCQAGTSLKRLSRVAYENSLSGLEFLHDIPGTVGGAIVNNTSAFGCSIRDLVESVTCFDIRKESINEMI